LLLPELSEKDARDNIAAIYADIRRLGGVPMVALIFRHLATVPGALEWMWDAVGPAWRSGRLQEAAWRIARAAPLEPLMPVPRAALRAWGVDAAGEAEIRIVLDAYNRANPENMLTILCVLRLLRGRTATAPAPGTHPGDAPRAASPWSPPPAPAPLAPMADVNTLPREISDVLDLVAAPGEPGGPRVVQSLYRHFCHRPAFLAAIVTLLRARFDDGSIDRAVKAVHTAMSAEAETIVRTLHAPPAPDMGIESTCARFSGAVIPQMIVVGRLIEDALAVT
jgi:hypothetical protein